MVGVTIVSGPPSAEISLTRGQTNPTTILNAPAVTVALTRQLGDGAKGDPGPPGPPGGGSFEFTQNEAQETWVVNHGLARYPGVSVTDLAGEAILADYRYLSENLVEVTFTYPNAGKVYLN